MCTDGVKLENAPKHSSESLHTMNRVSEASCTQTAAAVEQPHHHTGWLTNELIEKLSLHTHIAAMAHEQEEELTLISKPSSV
jgi:hypothetical protein